MTEISPEGTVWWCTHCGRIAADKQGRLAALGWTRECTQNAVLVYENTIKLDENGRVVEADLVDKSAQITFPRKLDAPKLDPAKGRSGAN